MPPKNEKERNWIKNRADDMLSTLKEVMEDISLYSISYNNKAKWVHNDGKAPDDFGLSEPVQLLLWDHHFTGKSVSLVVTLPNTQQRYIEQTIHDLYQEFHGPYSTVQVVDKRVRTEDGEQPQVVVTITLPSVKHKEARMAIQCLQTRVGEPIMQQFLTKEVTSYAPEYYNTTKKTSGVTLSWYESFGTWSHAKHSNQ